MLIITGLGNPEKDYRYTRHNVGFEALNKLAFDNNISFNKAKFRAHLAEGFIAGKKVILVKPQTYMNLSGEAVRDILNFYKLTAENLLVVYDDTSLDVGEIRVRKQGSAGGHNGMKNIIYHLESDVFDRIRIGIGEKPSGYDLKDYVLSRFSGSEKEKIVEGISKAADAIEIIVKESTNNAMNKYNKKKPKPENPTDEEKETSV